MKKKQNPSVGVDAVVRLPRKLKKVLKKIDRETGFTGQGPTALERPIKCKLTHRERIKYKKYINEVSEWKWQCWRKACISTTGEDPEDGGW